MIRTSTSGRASFAAFTLCSLSSALAASGAAPLAQAQTQNEPFGVFARSAGAAQSAQKFQRPDGRTVVIDRTGLAPLVQFEGEEEIYALRATPGPRGDEFLKTDTGVTIMRVTHLGGIILFTPDKPDGLALAPVGPAAALPLPAAPARGLGPGLEDLSRSVGKSTGQQIAFESSASGAPAGLALDAASRAAAALKDVRPGSGLRPIRKVQVQVGLQPQASVQDDTLRVTVTPKLGYAGRPSADAIKRALTGADKGAKPGE